LQTDVTYLDLGHQWAELRRGGEHEGSDQAYCTGTGVVDYPEEVKVTEVEGNRVIVLELRVAKADIGKLIGKQGRTAGAIRTILAGASAKTDKRHVLEIIE
jgi:predicted RNA-binding protein YlqC (UPF0109 family)